ncbi:Carboxypeptidase regulatory-like domain-containing protein [Bryocella elongata]|uniref:Carboxypeptidase regulatory-like domain-containing protein n=1 Tax=Bryocella elongata TaxID=863522 RepID=A0A1H6AH62_9BACT|nr:TonB-dependent receptor [Bryocella elongata]SEG48109.1 Carboxypeptidase regulatory-like domain-containing protein [Bryocella elongata]
MTFPSLIKKPAETLRYAVALFLALLLLSGGSALAQLAGKGAISGTVLDPTGAAVPGATITATSIANGVSTKAVSTSSGDFTVSLDPGAYSVTVSASGFEKLVQNNITVNALETVSLSPKLTVGGTDVSVTVDTIPPQLETTNATLGATMENEMYSALPIEMGAYGQADQRRATDFAFLMPGVQGNNTSGNPTTNTGIVNGSGSKGAVSDVYVDGVAFVRAGGNGDPRYVWTAISVDAVDQFQLQTSGYSAVYEGQGIQNYVIKQGGRSYHGSLYEFFRNTALDTWGFFGPAPNPVTGVVKKPIENSNEYGINLSGPLVPVGKWRDKLFAFGNYNGFRYASETPTAITFPTLAQQQGNFQGVVTGGIFDPNTQTQCTANNGGKPCRYRYGYVYGGTPTSGTGAAASAGDPVLGPGGAAGVDVIPASEFSAVALKMQSFLPSGIGTGNQNNFIAKNKTGLVNWSTTDRIDWVASKKDNVTFMAAIGRQASSNPVGQTTSGRNVGPIPYNYGQTYAPKTAVGIVELTHTFTPNVVNQLKYGYARYNGPTFDADQSPAYAATAMGISEASPGLPSGPASQAFPITTFAGTNAPTQWAGTTPSVTIAQNYTLVDNVQWVKGRHNLTFGAQIAWLLYNVNNATGGSTDLTLATAVTETEGLSNAYTGIANTGYSYASFLIGQIDKASFTQYLQQIYGARFRPISPYVQDNWKVSSKLTLDVGLRWDYFPSLREVHDAGSFFSPTTANPVTGANGALLFTGYGTNTCNCDTPVQKWYKNFGPRLGLAYQLDDKTVLRASYGIMFTHGGAVGGSATSLGTLGFSGGLSQSASGSLLSTAPLTAASGYVLPGYTLPTGVASGPGYGSSYTASPALTSSPQSMGYTDPYLGSRAPEFINWTFGMQHQWTTAITTTMTYVGSQGHFLPTDGGNPRGYYADQLDPKYLYLGSHLADTGATETADCTTYSLACPSNFNTGQQLNVALKPFPFQSVSDSFGYVGNANYNALQLQANMRPQHGLTFMINYTWAHSIDDGGTFRTGYAIPAGTIANEPNVSWAADRIERTTSTTNQKHHFVATAVYELPFGKQVFANHAWERAAFGGFKLSSVFQAYTGSPLAITGSSCQTNQAQSTCEPTLNPSWSGNPRINGKWGSGVTYGNYASTYFIQPSVCSTVTPPTGPFINPAAPSGQTSCLNTPYAPSYTFGNAPRTAAYNLYGQGLYQLDLALVRTVPLHLEHSSLDFRAEWYNVTNYTLFSMGSTAVGNSAFGTVAPNASAPRKSVQLTARLNF